MRRRWRIVLVSCGLFLFSVQTYYYIGWNHKLHKDRESRYFWWGSFRLDSDPLNRHHRDMPSCKGEEKDCGGWGPEYILVEPGLLEKSLILPAIPAVLVGGGIVHGLARFGVSEITSFMISMPLLISAWFYFVGWLLDRRRHKRSLRSNVPAT